MSPHHYGLDLVTVECDACGNEFLTGDPEQSLQECDPQHHLCGDCLDVSGRGQCLACDVECEE